MSLLSRLEKKLGRFAVPHLTLGLIVCQVVVYVVVQGQQHARPEGAAPLLERLDLVPNWVLEGEVWRLATFLVVPPFGNVVCAFFFWYLFYLMGTALEHYWGVFRYNVYLLLGYLATVAASFLTPDAPSSNGYLQASVFLAFALLFPDFELYLFFLLPVKIKWLALLTWITYFLVLVFGSWTSRLLVGASVFNFLVFFGKDILERVQTGRRSMAVRAARLAQKEKPYFHRCTVCGITDRTHPDMDFRYCSKCEGAWGYCTEHLRNHQHVTRAGEAAPE